MYMYAVVLFIPPFRKRRGNTILPLFVSLCKSIIFVCLTVRNNKFFECRIFLGNNALQIFEINTLLVKACHALGYNFVLTDVNFLFNNDFAYFV